MVRAEVLQGVRQMRFEGLLERHERGELLQEEAAEMLGISERTFRRWRDRLRDEGPEGLRDRRIGKPSSRRAAAEEILRMLGLYQERYEGFTVKHFHEQLQKRSINALRIPVNLTRQQQSLFSVALHVRIAPDELRGILQLLAHKGTFSQVIPPCTAARYHPLQLRSSSLVDHRVVVATFGCKILNHKF